MRLLTALLFLGLVCPMLRAQEADPKDPKAPRAREIVVEGVRVEARGQASRPTKVTSAEELAKLIGDKEALGKVLKVVDLKKEYLLVFAWAGSGGDKIALKEVSKGADGPVAVFTYTRGLTRDLRQHQKLFAIPNGTSFKIGN